MSHSQKLFQLMLRAYPREFRLEYGPEMTQLFRDCHHDIQADGLISAIAFWRRMILDVVQTAPLERWEALGRRYKTMKNLKGNVLGLLACLAIIVVAFLVFGYGKRHEVGTIWIFALDAIITAGIVSNLIIFPLVTLTRFSTFRTALWILVIVNGVLFGISALLGNLVGGFNLPSVLFSYLVSFAFWLTIHWLLSQIRTMRLQSG
jgi:hypothetical protein